MPSPKRDRSSEESEGKSAEDLLDRPVGGSAGQILISQHDYESEWLRVEWPPTGPVQVECMNPNCSSRSFDWEELEQGVLYALETGQAAAGSLRCEGTDRLTMSRCTNALIYIWEEELE